MLQRLKLLAIRLLRRGERYTGTDNVYLAKGGIFLSIASFMGSASSLALAMLFARLLGKGVYGTYQYLLSWGSILAIASVTGTSDALTRAVAQGHERTIYAVLKMRLRWAGIGTLGGLAVGAYYLSKGRTDLFWGFLIVAVFFPAISALSSWGDYANGRKAFGLQTRYGIASTLGTAAVVVAILLLHPTVIALTLGFCLSSLAWNAIALGATLRRLPPKGEASDDALRFGKNLTLLDVASSISNYLDRILIFTLLGSHETAVYAFAIAPPEQLKGYLKNLYVMALPKVAARPLNEIRPTFFRKLFLLIAAIGSVIIVYVLVAPQIYRQLFPGYAEAIPYSQIFSISLLGIASALPVAVFNGHMRYKENLHYQVSMSAISIVSLALFVWKWGLLGAICARTLARIFGLLHSTLLVRKILNVEPEASKNASPTLNAGGSLPSK